MRNSHIISRISIYLLAVILFCFGVFHFLHPHDLVIYVPQFLPGGKLWVYLVGAAFIIVALSFLFNRMVKVSAYVLALLLLTFILTIHLPNFMHAGDKEMKLQALISLLKDTAIACFALHIAAGAYHQKLHLENSD